eukprot:3222290-Rhodomonas_salina.1
MSPGRACCGSSSPGLIGWSPTAPTATRVHRSPGSRSHTSPRFPNVCHRTPCTLESWLEG